MGTRRGPIHVLRLRVPAEADAIKVLRAALKSLGRRYRLKAISIRPESARHGRRVSYAHGALRGLAHSQLYRQRGLWGVKLDPANRGRRLDAAERQTIEQKMRDDGRL